MPAKWNYQDWKMLRMQLKKVAESHWIETGSNTITRRTRDPIIEGIFKPPFFTSHLHPLSDTDDTLLLGIGQNVTNDGVDNIMPTGLMISIFNVSDPTTPSVLASYQFREQENADSNSQFDHKAVQYNDGKLTIPHSTYKHSFGSGDLEFFDGFVVLDVSNGIHEVFRVHHTNPLDGSCNGMPFFSPRSFMYEDGTLLTMSGNAAVSTNLNTGQEMWRMNLCK